MATTEHLEPAPDSPSEREKWVAELDIKLREVAVAEHTYDLAVREHELKALEQARSGWRSPLAVAILAATVAAGGNALVAHTNGSSQRELEREKSEQTRILEMIKTGNADRAAENLRFLLESGLISDQLTVAKLETFLKNRKSGSGPTLPAPGPQLGGIIGLDDAKKIEEVTAASPVRPAAQSVGRLLIYSNTQQVSTCTAFLVSKDVVLTASHCLPQAANQSEMKGRFVPTGSANASGYEVDAKPLARSVQIGEDQPNFALLRVTGNPGLKHGFLKIAARPVVEGEPLAMVMFRSDQQQYTVIDAEDCKVYSLLISSFRHRCDSGAGSSGAPILSRDGKSVIGVHGGRTSDGFATATRSDVLSRQIEIAIRVR